MRLRRLVDESARVFRAIFDSKIPPHQLMKTLNDSNLRKANLLPYQKRQIQKHKRSEKFDVALLIVLLRHFYYTTHTNDPLWKIEKNRQMDPAEQNDISQVIRIRNIRNKVCILSHS